MALVTKDALDRLFLELKAKRIDHDHKIRVANTLRQNLEATHRELSQAAFTAIYGDVAARISQLIVQGSDTYERIGGITALQALIDFKGDDAGQKTTRFAANLRTILRGNDLDAMVYAADALGKLATPGGTLTAELVESEVKISLEHLQIDRQENRRFAAVLVLKELASSSPTLLYQWVPQILEVIWVALRDPKVLIREEAAHALNACLNIMKDRDTEQRNRLFQRVYDEAMAGVNVKTSNTVETIHGSLLALKELLVKGAMFMHGPRYKDTCEVIMKYKDYKDKDNLIRRECTHLIPTLASYAPAEFTSSYLHQSMLYLQGLLKRDKDRNDAFSAIGKVASAVGSSIAPYLEGILAQIKDGLALKVRNKNIDEAPIFSCLSMISIAVGQALSKHMQSLLDPIFACGLSDSLTQALVDMAFYVPSAKATIQDKLLDLLSRVLAGRNFAHLGAPQHGLAPVQIWTRDKTEPSQVPAKEAEIALALHTLGSFDFFGHTLNEFVRDVAIRYVDADNPEIRKAAALTCCQLFVRDVIVHQTSQHSIQVVGDVIEKLLTVAVADEVPEIRRTVLLSLDARFDRHLGKAENVRTLFLALNDEVFSIREAAMTIIGRLTNVNPAYVFPSLRKVLIQLLTDIEYSDNSRSKEESAKLISHLVSASSQLIKPYVQPMIKVLIPRATDSNPEVASTTLQAIGNLADVGGEDMKPFVPELMEILIKNLQDTSSDSKRTAALHTLGQLALSCGYVIEPYKDFPNLLGDLKNIIKTEPPGLLRREAVKLIGILGALDPDEQEKLAEKVPENSKPLDKEVVTDVSLIMDGITPSNEEYYPKIVIHTLMELTKDTSLTQYHSQVIDAVMNIYQTMGLKCVGFLKDVIEGFMTVIKTAGITQAEAYFNNLSQLVRIVRQHIRPFLPGIISIIKEYWDKSATLQATILSLIESIARSLEGEFKVYLADVLPQMLGVLDNDTTPKRIPSNKVLHAFLIFGSSAEEYMHLIIPVIVRMFDKAGQPASIRKQAIETLGRISRQVNISEFSAKIIHPLIRVLDGNDTSLKQTALDTLCALIFQLGPDYIHFIPTVNKVLTKHKIPHSNYAVIVSKLQKGEPLPQNLSPDERYGDDDDDHIVADMPLKKLAVNQQHLKNAWEAEQKSTKDDWQEWMRRFSIELLRESPQQALRACTSLATVYTPIARTLFNSAFVSCWTELYEQYQEELVHAIETALTSQEITPDILQILLNLAEFMEHDDKALPIDVRVLGMYAAKCHAYAKALHYKELEFNAEQNPSAVEALISINNQLQQYDAAFGILRKAQNYHDVELKETWYEKLFRWEEALQSYQKREKDEGRETIESTMGKMRCLHALGEWETLSSLAQDKWIHASAEVRKTIAPLAAASAWGLRQWELMDNYLSVMKSTSPDRSFFGAILAIHRNQFDDAHAHIDRARGLIETELTALLGESYNRAYLQILRVQMLAELEEIMIYKHNTNNPEKLATMRETWMKRLKGCQANPEVWQRMLKVRALVISPKDNRQMWIKFTNLCRKNQRMGLAEKSLSGLLDTNEKVSDYIRMEGQNVPYPVSYATFKFMWATGEREEALDILKSFSTKVADDLSMRSRDAASSQVSVNGVNEVNGVNGSGSLTGVANAAANTNKSITEDYRLLAKCYLKQGEWQTTLNNGDWHHEDVHEILAAYHNATGYNQNWYKAWHAWALANFEVVTSYTSQGDRENVEIPTNIVQNHVVPAIEGFFKSISLSSSSSLQDTLRLLTLWFAHGNHLEVNTAVTDGVGTVSVDTWLEVIPQLLARINQPNARVRQSIHKLINDVGRAHPQGMVFPLTVSMKSDTPRRGRAAAALMDAMRQHSPQLVEQADLVSHELIRIAVLWHEQWHEGLEEASRLYFGDHNIEGMFATLTPLHVMLDKGPETLREISFIQSFGRELQEARDWCQTYRSTREIGDLNQAWDLYYQVFRKIARQLPSLMTLEMQYVSPKLKTLSGLELAVPGTYESGKPVISIASFDPVASVIQSKQRPRRLKIIGSDGLDHTYLLKGHEDIRQDERVMQLFGLCNTLLSNDNECRKRHLNIQKYSAIPLSTQSGLLSWVPHSDTLHVLIREYRDSRKILLNIEHRIMLQMAPDYDSLTLMQKVEVFGYALDNTTGQDLYRVLWLKSKSSEAWLGRRTNYTRSLAVMSMVGYILGLGDRHPSNLMLDKNTGKIIHIDFGDCFEVAMHREKYPERVPFRLTRMLTYAMEVSNIEGSYRTTCEHVMRVLRENKESVMAVLEAFIHDPLLTWRLNNRESPAEPNFPSDRRASIMSGIEPPSSSSKNNSSNNNNISESHPHRPDAYRPRNRSSAFAANKVDEAEAKEVQNARAIQVLARVKEKLTGRDFKSEEELGVERQVDRLIGEATNLENLCQHYIGWCSFW
ncbi:FAT-domain-containing protein [Tothia fuscella]|uniref:Serine/threonine-protein kinase TOR n=1 Tax=Tothia fuscella TaxID=1048955 RepID=A0A9P4NKI8_9PEZI|nr:FAT-domain-containing protein [Tothia fuscella]